MRADRKAKMLSVYVMMKLDWMDRIVIDDRMDKMVKIDRMVKVDRMDKMVTQWLGLTEC